MDTSALPFKPSENQRIILKLFEDYYESIPPKYLHGQYNDFHEHVDATLARWIEITGEPRLAWTRPMLFDFMLNDGDISHDAIKASVTNKRDNKITPPHKDDIKISRAYSKSQGINHSRNTLIRHIYKRFVDADRDISVLTNLRESLLENRELKGLKVNSDKYKVLIKDIMNILGYECSGETIHQVINEKKPSKKPDNTNYSYYD